MDQIQTEDLSVIEKVEAQYPETCAEFKRIQQADYAVFCKKQNDYGPHNISLGFPLSTQSEINASQSSIIFRCHDKVRRLLNLIVLSPNTTTPTNESIDDSWLDMSVYGIIARIVKNKKWSK